MRYQRITGIAAGIAMTLAGVFGGALFAQTCLDATGAPCAQVITPDQECDTFVNCAPGMICSPGGSPCPGSPVAMTRLRTVNNWPIGTCDPRIYRQCTSCPGPCQYTCTETRGFAGLDAGGNCAGACVTTNFGFAAGCRS